MVSATRTGLLPIDQGLYQQFRARGPFEQNELRQGFRPKSSLSPIDLTVSSLRNKDYSRTGMKKMSRKSDALVCIIG